MTSRASDAHFFGRSGVSLASTASILGESRGVVEAWERGRSTRRVHSQQQVEHVSPPSTGRTRRVTPQEGQNLDLFTLAP